MTHKQLEQKFKEKLDKRLEKPYFYYKIPDTKGLGGLRPFDSILLYRTIFFAIEFKAGRDQLKKHQMFFLKLVQACGGQSLLINEKHNLDDIIDVIKIAPQIYEKGKEVKP